MSSFFGCLQVRVVFNHGSLRDGLDSLGRLLLGSRVKETSLHSTVHLLVRLGLRLLHGRGFLLWCRSLRLN